MNNNGNTTNLNVSVSPRLKQRLWAEARRQRRNLSSMVRVFLEEALDLEETITPPEEDEYEAVLTRKQAAKLLRCGYQVVLADAEQLALPGV